MLFQMGRIVIYQFRNLLKMTPEQRLNKTNTGTSAPQSALEYAKSGSKNKVVINRTRTAKGNMCCEKCKANAKSANPGSPPVHQNCRCHLRGQALKNKMK